MNNLKIATYGRWCTGKTRQAAHLIELVGKDNVFIVSCSAGLQTIQGLFNPDNVHECSSLEDLRIAWNDLFIKNKIDSVDGERWVVFDGLTEACSWIESEELDALDRAARAVSRGERGGITDKKVKEMLRFVNSDGGPDQQKAYGPIGVRCKILIEGWTSGISERTNVYTTAHEQESQRDRQVGPPYIPQLPGKIAREFVMGKFDYVIRMVADNGGTAQLDPAKINLYWSRTRENREISGPLPKEIKGFNLAEFVNMVRGKKAND